MKNMSLLESIQITIPKCGETAVKETNLSEYLQETDIFETNGKKIIKYEALLALADTLGIVEKDIQTVIYPTDGNLQQHVVLLWLGFKGDQDKDNWSRGSGEASKLNTGKIQTTQNGGRKYVEHGEIDAMYRYAMAEKRAFSRAIKKFLNIRGAFVNVESRDFAQVTPNQITDHDY